MRASVASELELSLVRCLASSYTLCGCLGRCLSPKDNTKSDHNVFRVLELHSSGKTHKVMYQRCRQRQWGNTTGKLSTHTYNTLWRT